MAGPAASLQRTPLYNSHITLGARMVPFAGWEMPVTYEGQLAEHRAVRERAGIFDVSHMGQVRLKGERVFEYLTRLLPGNIARLKDGDSLYTAMCNHDGGVIDDLIVTRIAGDEAFAVVNAATRDKDVGWMQEQVREMEFDDVRIEDESEAWAMIAVQGPEALGILQKMLPDVEWAATKPFTLRTIQNGDTPLLVSRTGYTGEDGAELMCRAETAERWWLRLLELGAVPCGLAARDSLRLEKGYCLYGQDLSETISPLEGGIGWTVAWKKDEDFIGRRALEHQRRIGPPRRRVGLQIDQRRPLRANESVMLDDKAIGETTSGGFSPELNAGIALALVDAEKAKGAEVLNIIMRGKQMPARVVKPPFV